MSSAGDRRTIGSSHLLEPTGSVWDYLDGIARFSRTIPFAGCVTGLYGDTRTESTARWNEHSDNRNRSYCGHHIVDISGVEPLPPTYISLGRVDGYMGLIGSRSGGRRLYFECRQCGTTVDAKTDACPQCGSVDIVEYELA